MPCHGSADAPREMVESYFGFRVMALVKQAEPNTARTNVTRTKASSYWRTLEVSSEPGRLTFIARHARLRLVVNLINRKLLWLLCLALAISSFGNSLYKV